MNRQLSEIEARNSKMQSEAEKLRALNEELSSRLAAAQALYDRLENTESLSFLSLRRQNCVRYISKTIADHPATRR